MNELMRRLLFLPPQSSTIAPAVDHLHFFVIGTTMGGALFITVVGFWMVIRFRRPSEDQPPREQPVPRMSPWIEGGVVAGLLALFCVWWLIGFAQYLRMRVPPENTLDIYLTAKQWMWKFSYPDGNHTISTLYVPAGRPVKLIMTSRDVIHSFYVPDFRVKEDVLPGRYTTVWFQSDRAGTHQILCAEMCGAGHSTMRGEVVTLDAHDYQRWLGGARDLEPNLLPAGEKAAAELGCLRCHTLDGTPHIGPTWLGLYGSTVPLVGGATTVADEAYLTESMMDPQAKIHRGFQTVMPSYQGRLRPAETAAIVELIKSLRAVPRP